MCFKTNGLKNLKLNILMVFGLVPQVPILLYSSKNIRNSYNFYTYVLKFTWIHIIFIVLFCSECEFRKRLKTFLWIFVRYILFSIIRLFYAICNASSKNIFIVKISRIHIIFTLMFWNIRSNLFRVYSCCFIFFYGWWSVWQTRNEKWEMRN